MEILVILGGFMWRKTKPNKPNLLVLSSEFCGLRMVE